VFNIKKAICEWFKKPLVEVPLEYAPEEEIHEIGIPAQYFINALKDADKWEAWIGPDERGNTIRKLINKGTSDVVAWSRYLGVLTYSYPGESWMNYSEREAVENEAFQTYQRIVAAEKCRKDEASRQKMSKDYGEYEELV
jgi:hypothetical protein